MMINDLEYLELTAPEMASIEGAGFVFADTLTQVSLTPGGVSARADAIAIAEGFSNVYTNTLTFATVFNSPVNFGMAAAFSISYGFL